MKTHLKKLGLIFLMICCLGNSARGATYDWRGAIDNDVTKPGNWAIVQPGGILVLCSDVPGENDDVQIGVASVYTSVTAQVLGVCALGIQNIPFTVAANKLPIITTPIKWKSVTLGPLISNNTLTVNGTGSLTLSGDIAVAINNNVNNANGNNYLAGTGTITCNNIKLGAIGTTNSGNTILFSRVTTLNVLNNVNIILSTTISTGCGFRLEDGTMTLTNNISITNPNNINSSGTTVTTPNTNLGYFTINAKNSTSSAITNPNLRLLNSTALLNALPPQSAAGKNLATINFNGTSAIGGGTGGDISVYYIAANPTIYTKSTQGFGTGGGTIDLTGPPVPQYDNLYIQGTGTATVNSGSFYVEGTLNTSTTTAVDFDANDPTVNVITSWTNSTTINGGSGATTVGTDLSNTGIINMKAGNLTIGRNYTNTGTFTQTALLNNPAYAAATNTTTFTGVTPVLSNTNVSNVTTFNNLVFSGSSTSTPAMNGSGPFNIASAGTLLLKTAGAVLTINGSLTLKSDATGTASIAPLPSTTSPAAVAQIKGNVNVERYFTGGTGYRGYRLVSSPVNISTNLTGSGNLGLTYLNSTGKGLLTGGPGTGFTVNNRNPTVYLYDETRTTNNTTFVSGKNVGIVAINDGTATVPYSVSTLAGTVTTTNVAIPVANSYLVYFVGNNTNTSTAATRVPEPTTITAVGFINQGTVSFKWWKGGTTLSYSTGTGSSLSGISQVGNPFPSTINLKQVYADNNTMISPIFWELNEPGQAYMSYNAADSTTSNKKAGKYIVSGQGFLVAANGAGKTLTFKESQKISYPPAFVSTNTTTPALIMSTPKDMAKVLASETPAPMLSGLHLQMRLDSATNTQCGIYFDSKWDDNFNMMEDAVDLDGASPKVYMSSFTKDNMRTSINQLAAYTSGKRIKLFVKATTSGIYHLDLADIQNIDTTKYRLYLIDHYAKDSLDIGTNKSYTFNLLTSDTTTFGSNRFELAINKIPTSPYSLASFTAQKASNGILLTWRAYNEGNNILFDLEKLLDNNNYSSLYQKQSNGVTIYKFTDQTPNTGNNTYRLMQTNSETGASVYSNPVSIIYDKAATGTFNIYPNPTVQIINVNISSAKIDSAPASYKLNIYDAAGTLIVQKDISGNSWSQNVAQFKPGVYMMELKVENGTSLGKAKFVKN